MKYSGSFFKIHVEFKNSIMFVGCSLKILILKVQWFIKFEIVAGWLEGRGLARGGGLAQGGGWLEI